SEKVALVATDESGLYNRVGKKRRHEAVKHRRGEYVRGNVHMCTIGGFWSLLKRGIIGIGAITPDEPGHLRCCRSALLRRANWRTPQTRVFVAGKKDPRQLELSLETVH